MGAAVLATKACLRSGAGLTTAFIPRCGFVVMQSSAPEAMALIDDEEKFLSNLPDDVERFSAVGIGPGIGIEAETQKLLSFIIRRYSKPLIIDADGLNCLALNKNWLEALPSYSILTPHPKELDRLFGDHPSDFERMEKASSEAQRLKVIIVLKGHHTFIAMPNGQHYFNSTGNAGMAKGGSGDVLTGILASLLAQGYPPSPAALLSVYIHGWAGDFAAKKFSQEAMLPSDLITCLRDVFLELQGGVGMV
jgi:NAD(P)H-hydrate epimerase